MRVHLGSGNVGMAENRLHGSQIGAVLDHVRRATVTQHVRAGMTSGIRRCRFDHLPDPLAGELAGTPPGKE